jgi:hypothetical protein
MKTRSNPSWILVIPMFLLLGCDGETGQDVGTEDTATLNDIADVREDADQPASDIPDTEDPQTEEPTGDTTDPDLDVPLDPPVDGDPDQDEDTSQDADVDEDLTQDPDAVEDPTIDEDGDGEDDVPDVEPAACVVGFDCNPGENCSEGFCESFVTECTEGTGCVGDLECVAGTCVEPGYSAYSGQIVINEVLIDGNTDEDANGDGTVDSVEDAFVELVNISSEPIDISGWTLVERHFSTGLPRHTFVTGTECYPGDAVVVFGGGDPPDSTDTVLFLAANAEDLYISYGLDLDVAEGDRLRLLGDDGRIVAEFAYGGTSELPIVTDESTTRSPDLVGSYMRHTLAPGADGAIFSAGTRVDGSAFLP